MYLRKTMPSGIKFCSCFVFTVCTTYDVISYAESFVLLHQHFPQYVCSALCACLFSVFSWLRAYPVRCLSIFWMTLRWLWLASFITGITFVFTFHIRCVSVVRFSYSKMILASFLIRFSSPKIAIYKICYFFHCHVLWCPVYWKGWFCPFAILGYTIWLL